MTSKIKIFLTILIITASIVFLNSCSKNIERETVSAVRSNVMDAEIGMKVACPVTGNAVTVAKSTPVIEYNGERYFFCCPGCADKFMGNPEKYIGENSNKKEE